VTRVLRCHRGRVPVIAMQRDGMTVARALIKGDMPA
jgi:hypothetical protein